jgi:hypothetical protein
MHLFEAVQLAFFLLQFIIDRVILSGVQNGNPIEADVCTTSVSCFVILR